jgi:hypothetical protein
MNQQPIPLPPQFHNQSPLAQQTRARVVERSMETVENSGPAVGSKGKASSGTTDRETMNRQGNNDARTITQTTDTEPHLELSGESVEEANPQLDQKGVDTGVPLQEAGHDQHNFYDQNGQRSPMTWDPYGMYYQAPYYPM